MYSLKNKLQTPFLFHVSAPKQTHNFVSYVSKNNPKEYIMTLFYYSEMFLVSPPCS